MGILRGPLQQVASQTMAIKIFFLLATVAVVQIHTQVITPQIDAAITQQLKTVFQGIDVSSVSVEKKREACDNLKNSGQDQFMIDFSKKKLKELFGLDCNNLPSGANHNNLHSGANHIITSIIAIFSAFVIAKFL